MPLHRGVVEMAHLGVVGHVAGDGERPFPGELRQRIGCFSEPPFVRVGDHYGRALLDTPLGGREADAGPCRGGHHHDLAGEQTVTRRRLRRLGWLRRFGGPSGHRFAPLASVFGSVFGSGGSPSTRSPMMFRWISFEPP